MFLHIADVQISQILLYGNQLSTDLPLDIGLSCLSHLIVDQPQQVSSIFLRLVVGQSLLQAGRSAAEIAHVRLLQTQIIIVVGSIIGFFDMFIVKATAGAETIIAGIMATFYAFHV